MILYPSYLTLYKYTFIFALFAGESMILFRLQRHSRFALRFVLCTLGHLLFVTLLPTLGNNALFLSLMFTSFFALSALLVKVCFSISWKNSFFCTIIGYSIQHIASILYNMIVTFGGFEHSTQVYSTAPANLNPITALIFVEVYALIYLVMYHLFVKKIQMHENITIKNPPLLGTVVLMMLVEIVLNSFIVYRQYDNFDMTYFTCASLTNLLCTLAVLIILFGQLLRKTLEEELEVVNQMWRQERRQFDISKETIDMINIKCHDMKHQIHNIRKTATINPQALKEIEQNIDIYDSIVKTGNEALDIILAEKGLFCQRNSISINCIIDGEKLNFMRDIDIYSLFGNILDNAIHSVMNLEEEQRTISITAKSRGKLLSVNSHNYYSGEIEMEDGIPVTGSHDKVHHGFGIRSMILIVEKYGGSINFSSEDHIFNINILFPINDTRAAAGTK